jgi:glycosyltransferase involved in cell wall biosynthesis
MNIYYSSLYYLNDFSSGANKRFDEIGKRLLKEHTNNFKCIITFNNRPIWCPIENCIFIKEYSNKFQRMVSWLELSFKLARLPKGIFVNDFMPIPFFSYRHYHFQTIYDLRNFDGFGRGGLGFLTESFQKRQLASADKVITISEFTSKAIQNYCSIKESDIIVSYCGIDDKKIEYQNSERDIDILYVATFEKRKNHINLIKAIELCERSLNITFVGSDNGLKGEIVNLASKLESKGHNIIFLEQISEKTLCEMYSRAKVFCFPSFYEGFGMPLIEAYQLGCNVVCSDIDVFKEITLNKAIYFDPNSPKDISDKLRSSLKLNSCDDSIREEIINFYSWDHIFKSFNSTIMDSISKKSKNLKVIS